MKPINKEKVQYVFIAITIVVLLAMVSLGLYLFLSQEDVLIKYKNDPDKKVFVERIEDMLKKQNKTKDEIVDIGLNYYALGGYDEAIYYYREALKLDPEDAVQIRNVAIALRDSKKYLEAEEYFLKSLAKNSSQENIYVELSEMYRYFPKKEYKHDEESIFLDGIKKNPTSVFLLTNLANFYKEKGIVDKATEYYNKALEQDPDNVSAKQGLEELKIKNPA